MLKFIAQVLIYDEGEYLEKAIRPWVNACESIDIFEGAFMTTTNLGYPPRSQDNTCEVARSLEKEFSNVHLTHHNEWNEPILRNNHLFSTTQRFGREDTCLFILDGDEVYTEAEVQACIKQVEAEKDAYNTWWVSMRNFVSDTDHFHEGFTVPRFFNLKTALGFSGYNDVAFSDGIKKTSVQGVLPNHYSWTPMEKARRKIKWQTLSLGWLCGWVEKDGKIVPNDEYYEKTGKTKPIIYQK